MGYKFITTKAEITALNLPMDKFRVWDQIKKRTPYRVSHILSDGKGSFVLYHQFPPYGVFCIEYISKADRRLLDELRRRCFLAYNKSDAPYIYRYGEYGAPNVDIGYTRRCHTLVGAPAYVPTDGLMVARVLLCYYRHVLGIDSPRKLEGFQLALERIILGE